MLTQKAEGFSQGEVAAAKCKMVAFLYSSFLKQLYISAYNLQFKDSLLAQVLQTAELF